MRVPLSGLGLRAAGVLSAVSNRPATMPSSPSSRQMIEQISAEGRRPPVACRGQGIARGHALHQDSATSAGPSQSAFTLAPQASHSILLSPRVVLAARSPRARPLATSSPVLSKSK
jgi:hypothetical protein